MAFRRRFRRRRFGGRRAVARKEPIWITTAFNVSAPPNAIQQMLFQLVGPEDYTPDYLTEVSRKDRCTLVRTVGDFLISPIQIVAPDSIVQPSWKAVLFVAGDKEIDDAFANDPNQFDILNTATFVAFCRSFSPMHVFWSQYITRTYVATALSALHPVWEPPAISGRNPWDVTVKRKMEGDDALFLLINLVAFQQPVDEIAATVDVESRNLIMDQ